MGGETEGRIGQTCLCYTRNESYQLCCKPEVPHLPRTLGWASESSFRSQKPRTWAAGIAGISTALLHLKIYDGPEVIRKNRTVFDFRKLLFNVLVVFKALKLPPVYILHTLFLHCYSNGLNQGKQT